MSDSRPRLDRLQAWMQAVVTDPRGAALAVEDTLEAGSVETLVTPSQHLTALERLEIYNRAYRARLLECFRVEFPALRHACGEELFRLFVDSYLDAQPPHSYTLGRLGEGFVAYLRTSRPDADFAEDERWPWADFLVELATLERTRLEVYDGEGAEGRGLLSANDLLGMPRSAFLALQIETVPGLCLLDMRYPVDEYLLAFRRGEEPSIPDPDPCALAIHRHDWVVRLNRLLPGESDLLAALQEGETVGRAIERVAERTGGALPEPEARTALLTRAEEGFLLALPYGWAS